MITPAVEEDGFAITAAVLPSAVQAELADTFDAPIASGVGGIRNILRDSPIARDIALHPAIRALVTPFLGDNCFAVRGILFDKTADGTNWKVPYHQDLSLAVSHLLKRSPLDWGPWTEKAGVPHVQPPVDVLERMLTVRLHLDPCGPENGPLRVLPGTHRNGRLSAGDIAHLRTEIPEVLCTVSSGGVVLMRPLLLHASSPVTQSGSRRRVLHIEYAAASIRLPDGLDWYERIQ